MAEEGGSSEPLPCAVIEAGDDAAALEASLIENLARLDPDEVNQWETFTRLVKEGRTPEDIAATFGLFERMVARVLALGNLHPRIRQLYAREKIDAATMRHLTLAPLARQRQWLALFRDPEARAPTGHQLKAWLFGEERYFSDVDAFWTLQNAAVEAMAGRIAPAAGRGSRSFRRVSGSAATSMRTSPRPRAARCSSACRCAARSRSMRGGWPVFLHGHRPRRHRAVSG